MTTNRIHPNDTIFVVDLHAEEIYEMTAGWFAEHLSDLDNKIIYDPIADAYCIQTVITPTNEKIFSSFYESHADAADDLFLRNFSAAASAEGVAWFKTRKAAERHFELQFGKLAEVTE